MSQVINFKIKKKGISNVDSIEIMFEGIVATGKNAFYMSAKIPKENIEGSRESSNRKEFVDP